MPLPKGFIKKVSFIKQNVGPEKRQDFLDDIDYKGTYLPKGVSYEDIDQTFIDFVDTELSLEIDGELVPVRFLTIQRFSEFSKTWAFSDKFKNLKMPFITVVRQPDIQVGTNQAGIWNIPGKQLYTYMKVPTFIDGRKGMDTYKIQQPTSVDVTYDVRFFCNRMKDLNKLHTIVQTTFNSRQFYINVNAHPMPIHLEKIGDESQKDDFDKRRFYVQHFEMKVLGYILDEEDFEHIPTINRSSVQFKVVSNFDRKNKVKPQIIVSNLNDNESEYTFNFKPNSLLEVTFNSDVNITFNEIINIYNITNVIIYKNGVEVSNGLVLTTPINTIVGDVIKIEITTDNVNILSTFQLKGTLNII